MFIIMYAKITVDKVEGPTLSGVYFGGISPLEDEADGIAERCTSETQGGLIIPKVLPMGERSLFQASAFLRTQFEKMADRMLDNHKTLNR